jgi:UDP-glucose 4-epimerase
MALRILVTGSSGFIGSAIAAALANAGYYVRAASRKRTAIADAPGVEWIELPDLAGEVDWPPLLDGIDVVVHLAAIAHRSHIDSGQYTRANRLATASLVQACAQHGVAGVPFTILRPVIVYGPGAKANIAMMMKIATLPVPLPFGSFKNRRSLLSIDNLVHAVMVCLENAETINRTFIVCDPEPITLAEMIETLREAAGRPRNLLPIPPVAVRALIVAAGRQSLWDRIGRDLVASSADLQNVGWVPRVRTRDGLRAMMKAAMLPQQDSST